MTSKTSKNTRPAKRRARKTTERPLTHAAYRAHERALLEGHQYKAVRQAYFCVRMGGDEIPIAGTERPLPCPFCGSSDDVIVVIDNERPRVHVECGVCGAESSAAHLSEKVTTAYGLILEATRWWNARNGVDQRGKRVMS